MSKKIQLIIGSTRQNRIAPGIATWIKSVVEKNDQLQLEVVDLKEVNLPMFDEPTPPSMAPGTSEAAKAWSAKVSSADAFIILSPEYNAGYPAPLKNAVDYLQVEWQNRPVTIISYGVGGGLSAAEQLKQVFIRLRAELVESGVAITIGDILDANNPAASLSSYEAPLQAALDAIIAYQKP